MPAITLEGMADNGELAPELVGEIFTKATDSSVVGKVAGQTAMSMTGSEYVIMTDEPEADIVGEGESKPVSDMGFTTKTVRPVKAATIVYWSREARIKNPGGVFDDIQQKMAAALQRQIDYAVLYGKGVKSGSQISGVEYLNQATSRVTLGTAATKDGGLTKDFLNGYDKVLEADADFTGFVADPRLRSKLMGAVDANGQPIYQAAPNFADPFGTVFGLPISYGKSVSGRVGGNTDTGVRAFGGDFANNVKLGFVEQISFKTSDQATLTDGKNTVSLWQTNQEAALVEATFGWVINDVKNAFVAYEAGTSGSGGGGGSST